MGNFETLTAAGLKRLLGEIGGSDVPVFVTTATGAFLRPAIGLSRQGERIIITCAPPSAGSWSSSVDWSLSDSAIAARFGITRQAVNRMRRSRFKRKPDC